MTPLAINLTPEDDGGNVYGKTVSELQTGVTISETAISGTLHNVTAYTGFSGDVAEQSGHYLALKLEYPEGATVKVHLTGSPKGEFTMPAGDHSLVCRITAKDTQTLTISGSKEGTEPSNKTYTLTGLTLEE